MQTAISYMKNYWNNIFFIEDNLLWVKIKIRGEPARVCLVLPNHKINEVLGNNHGTLFTGHGGVDKTKAKLQQNYWWPNINSTILDFIKTCDKCQKNRTDVHPKPDLLTLLPI
jgi:hypothetical protein